mmetsp:Transcript_14775/g.41169  ORF Transcript_14775/g.41169 Transcript_14775/m.41169 type:complete len:93 (-) Transcript_14775:265-543(-)
MTTKLLILLGLVHRVGLVVLTPAVREVRYGVNVKFDTENTVPLWSWRQSENTSTKKYMKSRVRKDVPVQPFRAQTSTIGVNIGQQRLVCFLP